jgi:hypothetical protein
MCCNRVVLKRFSALSTSSVDKRVENTLLTGREGSIQAGFNTLLISQAKFFFKKIKYLQIG